MRQLKLWARMIVNKQYDDMEVPPNIPIITGGIKRPARRESLSEALSSAATALTKALAGQTTNLKTPPRPKTPIPTPNDSPSGMSPATKAKITTQYISQLKSLQELREMGVLDDNEFEEQKTFALRNLRKLNTQSAKV